MINRRELLKIMGKLPVVGGLVGTGAALPVAAAAAQTSGRNCLAELGIRPVINAQGVVTMLTGSLMPPEVVAAMNSVSGQFVSLVELNEKVGARIAKMLRCEDALVSCGAASAITLATAASITGKDPEKIRLLPNPPGSQREVIVPTGHRIYPQQFLACGVKLVEVGNAAEMERALNANTVMAFYFNAARVATIDHKDFLRVAQMRRVPTLIDCASDVPPVSNLFKYTEMGFDLVTFSGGKAISGPQSAGLLFGRKDLIQAARLNHSPNQSIGRGMKVSKEEMIGMMVALEVYLKKDHAKQLKEWEHGREQIVAGLRGIPSLVTEKYMPEVANHVPHLKLTWNEQTIPISPADFAQKLRSGDPAIEPLGGRDSITYNMFMLQPGEAAIIARRTKEILEAARLGRA